MNKRNLGRLGVLTLCSFFTVVGLQLFPTASALRAVPEDDAKNAAQKDANANKTATPDRDRNAADRNADQDRNQKRAWIGIRLEDRDNQPGPRDQAKQDNQPGVGVTAIYPNGPAARGGLQAGDRIVSINGKAVSNPKDVSEGIARIQPGAKAEIAVKRNNADQTVTVMVGDAAAFHPHQGNQGNFQQQSYSYGGQPGFGQGYPAQGYQQGNAGQQGQNPQGANHYEGVPEHAMMLEYHRRNAEQHQRMESQIEELLQEVKNLRKEIQQLKAK